MYLRHLFFIFAKRLTEKHEFGERGINWVEMAESQIKKKNRSCQGKVFDWRNRLTRRSFSKRFFYLRIDLKLRTYDFCSLIVKRISGKVWREFFSFEVGESGVRYIGYFERLRHHPRQISTLENFLIVYLSSEEYLYRNVWLSV